MRSMLAVALLVVPLAAPAQGQCSDSCAPGRDLSLARTAAINAGLGAVTAGALAGLRGGSIPRAFLQGAAGGGITHLGKVVAAGRWEGAGLAGRQVAALGSSVTWNAAELRAPLARLMLPLGPVRLYLEPAAGRVDPRLDVAGLVAAADFALGSGARLDAGASLADGTLVFRRPAADGVPQGWHRSGITGYRLRPEGHPESEIRSARAHERVHVIQHDQSFLLWTGALEQEALRAAGAGRWARWVDPGLNTVLASVASLGIPYMRRPWEREAFLLAREAEQGGYLPVDAGAKALTGAGWSRIPRD